MSTTPKFTKVQKDYLRDFVNNKLVVVQYVIDLLYEYYEGAEIYDADKNIKLISDFLKDLKDDDK